jgi:hypothetical protein
LGVFQRSILKTSKCKTCETLNHFHILFDLHPAFCLLQ